MRKRRLLLCCVLALAGASSVSAQAEHHVCRLLKPDEVKALLAPTIVLANVIEEGPERSVCQYEGDHSPVFILTVYWKGGKNQWNASTAALKAGDQMLGGRRLLQRPASVAGPEGRRPPRAEHGPAEGSGEQIPAARREAPVAHMTVR